ncbi:MAG TPA: hypothetical protein VEG34_11330, partial [Thermoanaerobaculia bacterium]|nr:hypothetical protein [Thermoanaerobaculia bacterium]
IDLLATPLIGFQGIRGVLFVDVAGAYFDKFQDFDFYNNETSRLQDALLAYGYGFTVRLFGFDANWDFAQQYDLEERIGGFRTSFWIGTRF